MRRQVTRVFIKAAVKEHVRIVLFRFINNTDHWASASGDGSTIKGYSTRNLPRNKTASGPVGDLPRQPLMLRDPFCPVPLG